MPTGLEALIGCICFNASTISTSVKSWDRSSIMEWVIFFSSGCKKSIEPLALLAKKRDRKYSIICASRLTFSSQTPSSFFKVTNLLQHLRFEAFVWMNLEFLSPSFSHNTLDLCFHIISSLSSQTFTSLQAIKMSTGF